MSITQKPHNEKSRKEHGKIFKKPKFKFDGKKRTYKWFNGKVKEVTK